MKKNGLVMKTVSMFLAGIMIFGLAACGDKDAVDGISEGEFVYVPQFYELKVGEDAYAGEVQIVGDKIYYQVTSYGEDYKEQTFYKEIADMEAAPVLLYEQAIGTVEEGYESYNVANIMLEDGGRVFVENKMPAIDYETATDADFERREREAVYALKKIAADGSVVFEVDFTPYIQQAEGYSWLSYAIADAEGNIYLGNGETHMWVFDKDGNIICTVDLTNTLNGGYMHSLGLLSDGRVAALVDNMGTLTILTLDLAQKKFTDSYNNLPPNCYNAKISSYPGGGILLNGNEALFEYDLETQTYKELLNWLDCDMNPDYVQSVYGMENGDILVYYQEWTNNVPSIILLKKTAASEVVKKEVLTIGCMSLSQDLQSAVVDFNKSNEQYKIEVKDYTASIDWSTADESAYTDARTRFLNDLITGNGPDMFVAGNVNLAQFVEKGIVEDLAPYLEASEVLNREDMFVSILNALTIDGVLCTIPTNFNVSGLVGRTSEIGDKESGWTVEELMAYLAQYPDAMWLSYTGPNLVLQYSLMFDTDSYINWETGECSFDTPEFKKVLELAAGYYGIEPDYEISTPKLLANHEVLMDTLEISSVSDYQVAKLMFGEPITVIGFPTADGEGGIAASVNSSLCINAASANKDVAWTFIESMLTEDVLQDSMYMWGIPINKKVFDAQLKEAMTPTYLTDMEGNQVLDENGNPIEVSTHSYGWEDVTFDIYAATQEEADEIMGIINRIDTVASYDEQLMNIVFEEAESYFTGQKSLDEVADIIQSRVKIYVNESR